MKIAVDIDDTLNIVERAKRAGAYIERKGLPFRLKDEYSNMFVNVFDWTLDDVLVFIRDGGISAFTEAAARKGARETLEGWKREGHEITILTSRIKEWFGNPVNLSRDWLQKRRIPFDIIVAEIADKGSYCAEHGISILIDDNLENCLGAQKRGVYAILALGRHNYARAEEIFFGGANWREIGQCAERIVQTLCTQEALMRCNPAVKTVREDGWELRLDGRKNRRFNSIQPVAPFERPLAEKLAHAERVYAAAGKPCRFLLTSLDGALDRELAVRGYASEAPSEVWTLELPDSAKEAAAETTLTDEWRRAYETLKGESFFGGRENGIYLRLSVDGVPVAVVSGGRAGNTLCIYDLFVRPDCRRKGYGRQILEQLLAEGRRSGATRACLQVEADNAAAKLLYRGLGFAKAYEYHYRSKTI